MKHLHSVFLLLGLLLLANACQKEDDYNIQNLNHNNIMILGHAGMGEFYKYPNDSWESIEPVLGIGADGTEMDVQITKDSVLILFHDETLDGRTKCGNYQSPYHYNWAEIQNCLYNNAFFEIPICTVDEVFSRIPNLTNYYFSFDIKLNSEFQNDSAYRDLFLRAIKRVCEKHYISKNVFIEGDLDMQLKAKQLGLKTKGILIGSNVDEAVKNNIFGIGFTVDASKDEIEYAHQKGIYVMMWGAKSDAGNKKAIELNADFLQTDKPIPMLMLFSRFNYSYKIP
ncbi:MAG TPA: glycerophosphodiester phosphodiesterase family protein [Bacteroidales bacterium]